MDSVEKSLGELASLTGGRVVGDPSVVIKGIASIEDASPGDVTFIADKRYIKLLKSCRASALIAADELENAPLPEGLNLVLVKNPQLAFAKALEVLRPAYAPAPGVHAAAVIHPKAVLGKGVSAGACAVVEEGAKIGDNTVLYPGVYIGRNAQIGPDCIIHSGVAIREGCRVGKRVIIHCNSVIGSDGFGYARAGSAHYKIPQTGTVRIEDDVEIGACVTVDRATLGETVIGRGTKIDNLVQIAHNVKVGEDSILVAQVGIAGSSTVGSRVQLGGQTGIAGHIEIGSDVLVGAKSGVTADLAKGAYSGMPAIPHAEWLRAQNIYKKLPEIWKRMLELEKRLKELEGSE